MAKRKEIKFEVDEESKEGIYSNVVRITHGLHDFTLDFGLYIEDEQKFKVLARIRTSPSHAKSLLNALKGNIDKYEEKFGDIKLPVEKGGEEEEEELTYIA